MNLDDTTPMNFLFGTGKSLSLPFLIFVSGAVFSFIWKVHWELDWKTKLTHLAGRQRIYQHKEVRSCFPAVQIIIRNVASLAAITEK